VPTKKQLSLVVWLWVMTLPLTGNIINSWFKSILIKINPPVSAQVELNTPVEIMLPEAKLPSVPSVSLTNAHQGWNLNLQVDQVPYDLYIPLNYGENTEKQLPCVLVLPGWNFPRTSWLDHSRLVDYADRYGYALILPEMGKTIYESEYYPQTTLKWNAIPGGKFIKDHLIPTIAQRHHLLQQGNYNTLLGLSTGGRGVVLIALENPDLFVAGASLSGDFSQENMPDDNLMTAVYGAYTQYPQRWLGRDNPQARVKEWKMPLYLAHGTDDLIVPSAQSRLFYEALKAQHQDLIPLQYHAIAQAGHDYQFWNGQLENIFRFFSQPIN
jgi:putative tributyrin esterase